MAYHLANEIIKLMRFDFFLDWKLFLFGVTWGLTVPATVGSKKLSCSIVHVGPLCFVFKWPMK